VQLEDDVRRGTCLLVQPVDVLGEQRPQPPLVLEVGQRACPALGVMSPNAWSRRISQARRRISGSLT
jgi:hypothetical protein